MGIKRPFEEEHFPEPSFKQLKQVDCSIDQSLNTEEPQVTSWEVDSAGKCAIQYICISIKSFSLYLLRFVPEGKTTSSSYVYFSLCPVYLKFEFFLCLRFVVNHN